MSNELEQNVREIHKIIQQVPDLHDEVKCLRKEMAPLRTQAALAKEHRDKTCPRRHAGMTTIMVAVFIALLTVSGFALAGWWNNEIETTVKTLP